MDIKLKLVYRNSDNRKIRVLRKINLKDLETPLHTVLNYCFQTGQGIDNLYHNMLVSIPMNLNSCIYVYIDMCVDGCEISRCKPFLIKSETSGNILFLTDLIVAYFIIMSNDLQLKIYAKNFIKE